MTGYTSGSGDTVVGPFLFSIFPNQRLEHSNIHLDLLHGR
jgi:hypothetical protein